DFHDLATLFFLFLPLALLAREAPVLPAAPRFLALARPPVFFLPAGRAIRFFGAAGVPSGLASAPTGSTRTRYRTRWTMPRIWGVSSWTTEWLMRRSPSASIVRLCFSMQRILLRSCVILTSAIGPRRVLGADPQELAHRLAARGRDVAGVPQALKSRHRGLDHVVGIPRAARLREHVLV